MTKYTKELHNLLRQLEKANVFLSWKTDPTGGVFL